MRDSRDHPISRLTMVNYSQNWQGLCKEGDLMLLDDYDTLPRQDQTLSLLTHFADPTQVIVAKSGGSKLSAQLM